MIELVAAETVEEVEAILKDPEIFERISNHGQSVDDFNAPVEEGNSYLMIHAGEDVAGLFHLHRCNGSTLEVHCNILKDHRDKAGAAGFELMKWLDDDCPDCYVKFIAEVPKVYPEVYHFTKKFGFIDEGINRLSVVKYGELVDQWRVGITRAEVSEWVQQQQ
jgi:hypothetical protein